jgi:hypothetical protein
MVHILLHGFVRDLCNAQHVAKIEITNTNAWVLHCSKQDFTEVTCNLLYVAVYDCVVKGWVDEREVWELEQMLHFENARLSRHQGPVVRGRSWLQNDR